MTEYHQPQKSRASITIKEELDAELGAMEGAQENKVDEESQNSSVNYYNHDIILQSFE